MKILIIGGAGFIGSHLCEAYSVNHDVTSIDNYISGKLDNHIENVEYINLDVENILSIDKKFDIIFHFGEYSRVEQSLAKIDFVLKNNTSPILKVLKFAKKSRAKLIYAGSSTKFADNGKNIFKSPYSFSKWQNSELVKFYCDLHQMPYAITYFYNVYGGRENSQGEFATVVAKFLHRKKQNKKLQVTKPGTQSRNFTHIDDIVNGCYLAWKKGKQNHYMLGTKKTYSIIDIAKMFKSKIKYLPSRPGERFGSTITNNNAKKILGYTAKKEIYDYIKNIVKKK